MYSIAELFNGTELDNDLDWDPDAGVAWQRDVTRLIDYAEGYWNTYEGREHTPIARKLNEFRYTLAEKYCTSVLDMGIGCGEFLKKVRLDPALGYDVNPVAVKWLQDRGIYCDPYESFPDVDGITFWDVLEHIPDPRKIMDLIPGRCHVFVSIPVFADLSQLRESKHYKLGEHLLYATEQGMRNVIQRLGFDLVETRDDETQAGRENIKTFVFRRRLKDRNNSW